MKSSNPHQKETIKNPIYFKKFKKEVIGSKVVSIKRRGKNILIQLNNQKTILIHLKMTGHLLFNNHQKNKYIHVIFYFRGNKNLAFSDLRKFGKITLLNSPLSLGPEPLGFNLKIKKFIKIIKSQKRKMKQVLLDQKVIAGIGNIYSDEILWEAGIHPETKAENIPLFKIKKMFVVMKKILRKAIKLRGDSISDYFNIDGQKGKYQLHHKAYQQTGKKCFKKGCSGVITRIKIGSRSAHFCSQHQKLKFLGS